MKTSLFTSHAKKHMKTFIATSLSLVMLFSLVACNSNEASSTLKDEEETEVTTTESSESEETKEIAEISHAQLTPADMPGTFLATGKINTAYGNTYMSDSIDGFLTLVDFDTNTEFSYYNTTYNVYMNLSVGKSDIVSVSLAITDAESNRVNYFFSGLEPDKIDDLFDNLDNSNYTTYYGETISDCLFEYQGEIPAENVKSDAAIILSRFITLGDIALADFGYKWSDFGFDFGDNISSANTTQFLNCDYRNGIELHSFENGICTDGNLTVYEYLSSSIESICLTRGDEANEYGYAFVAPRSQEMLHPTDAMSFEYYCYRNYVAINYDSNETTDGGFRCQLIIYPDSDEITIMFAVSGETTVETGEPGVVRGVNDSWFFLTCNASELSEVCSSEENLMAASELKMNEEGNYGEYTYEEVCRMFLRYYDTITNSYDNALGYFGVSLEDIGINYQTTTTTNP